MTSVERTAYPRFKRLVTAHELHLFFTPSREEAQWAAERTDSDAHHLALLLALKSYQRMGHFPKLDRVPDRVVEFVRRAVDLPEGTRPAYASEKTAKNHRGLVRQRVGVTYDQVRAREIAEAAIRAEAASKNRPADLINVALEKVVEAGLELPAFSTFDTLASTVRGEVNTAICAGVHGRMSAEERERPLGLLDTYGEDGKTLFNRLKQPAKRPSWSHLRDLAAHLDWVDGLGATEVWLDGVAPSKVTDFAGEADAPLLRDYTQVKRVTLLASLAHKARQRARDDLAAMFCKRVAVKVKAARTELDEIRQRQQATVDRLVANYKTLLQQVDADGPAAARQQAAADLAAKTLEALGGLTTAGGDSGAAAFGRPSAEAGPAEVAALLEALDVQAGGLGLVRAAVEGFGGFAAQYADIEAVAAHHGDNYELLIARHLRKDRAAMFDLAGLLELTATSQLLDLPGQLDDQRGLRGDRGVLLRDQACELLIARPAAGLHTASLAITAHDHNHQHDHRTRSGEPQATPMTLAEQLLGRYSGDQ